MTDKPRLTEETDPLWQVYKVLNKRKQWMLKNTALEQKDYLITDVCNVMMDALVNKKLIEFYTNKYVKAIKERISKTDILHATERSVGYNEGLMAAAEYFEILKPISNKKSNKDIAKETSILANAFKDPEEFPF
jgi:hypothetical protein